MPRSLSILAGLLLASGCSVFGVRVGESPDYEVVDTAKPDIEMRQYGSNVEPAVEMRRYGPRAVVETTVWGEEPESRAEAFRALSEYLSGANQTNEDLALTRPVEVDHSTQRSIVSREVAMTPADQVSGGGAPGVGAGAGGQTTVRVYLPAGRAWENLPEPTDPRVHLLQLPDETLAVMRLQGNRPRVDDSRTTNLLMIARDAGWRAEGRTFLLLWDRPWTIPVLRRDELAVRVVRDESRQGR